MTDTPRRRSATERKPVNWTAWVQDGRKHVPCKIVDVSRSGMKVVFEQALPQQEYVTICCEKFGAIEAKIVWTKSGYAGLKFSDRTAAAKLKPLLRFGFVATPTETVAWRKKLWPA